MSEEPAQEERQRQEHLLAAVTCLFTRASYLTAAQIRTPAYAPGLLSPTKTYSFQPVASPPRVTMSPFLYYRKARKEPEADQEQVAVGLRRVSLHQHLLLLSLFLSLG